MKLKLLGLTTAITLFAGAAFAAIDGNQLADDYLAEGYTYVEVKVGPTTTKVEAVKEGIKVEVIYDNETFEILKQEQEAADAEYLGRTGKEVETTKRDFEKKEDHHGGKGAKDDDDDHDSGHDGKDDDDDDDDDDDNDDDHSGKGSNDD